MWKQFHSVEEIHAKPLIIIVGYQYHGTFRFVIHLRFIFDESTKELNLFSKNWIWKNWRINGTKNEEVIWFPSNMFILLNIFFLTFMRKSTILFFFISYDILTKWCMTNKRNLVFNEIEQAEILLSKAC